MQHQGRVCNHGPWAWLRSRSARTLFGGLFSLPPPGSLGPKLPPLPGSGETILPSVFLGHGCVRLWVGDFGGDSGGGGWLAQEW